MDPVITRLLESYFDKIFVVSIERAKDRHIRVSKQLEGLAFEFFWGTDKQELDWEKIKTDNAVYDDAKAKKNNRYSKGLNLGEVACALSHRRLYEHIIAKKYNRVLIFEDDVLPVSENLSQLPATIDELPPDWGLVYLGYTKHEIITPALKRKQAFYRVISPLRLIKWNSTMIKNLLPVLYSRHLKKAGYHDCTHAYAVTLQIAIALISKQTPVAFNADGLLSNSVLKGEVKAFVTEPIFFIQENQLDPEHLSIIKK